MPLWALQLMFLMKGRIDMTLHIRVLYWLLIFQIISCLTIVIGSLFKEEPGREVGFCTTFLLLGVAGFFNLVAGLKQMKVEQKPAPAPEPTEPVPPEDEPATDE
jgi:hypothetical protein